MTRRRIPPERTLDPNVEVRGIVVVGYLRSAAGTSQTFADRFEAQLGMRGISDPEMGGWYEATALQDALFETAAAIGEKPLLDAGQEMVKLSDWPESLSSVAGALDEIGDEHERAHRNTEAENIGGFDLQHVADGEAVIHCGPFPYPEPIARGAITETIQIFTDEPNAITVEERHPDEADANASTLEFDATW